MPQRRRKAPRVAPSTWLSQINQYSRTETGPSHPLSVSPAVASHSQSVRPDDRAACLGSFWLAQSPLLAGACSAWPLPKPCSTAAPLPAPCLALGEHSLAGEVSLCPLRFSWDPQLVTPNQPSMFWVSSVSPVKWSPPGRWLWALGARGAPAPGAGPVSAQRANFREGGRWGDGLCGPWKDGAVPGSCHIASPELRAPGSSSRQMGGAGRSSVTASNRGQLSPPAAVSSWSTVLPCEHKEPYSISCKKP